MSLEYRFLVTLTIGTSEVEIALRAELDLEDCEAERAPW